MGLHQYCSKEECIERQGLGQVSELEATLQTCRLSQSNRILDPRIAVSKYRRSAAGGDDGRPVRNKTQLQKTLSHLIQICATLRPTPDHPPIENMDTVIHFVVDRLRACQSDATRRMSNPKTCVPSSWHAKVIRILIWLRYHSCGPTEGDNVTANSTARTIDHMRSTAYDAYWNTLDPQPEFVRIDDDEMLCYDATTRMCAALKHSATNCATSLESSWNGMLLEFQKRRRPENIYPQWNLILRIASHTRREEFYVLWKEDHPLTKELPVLAKLILSGEVMLLGRYRTVQHYNKSFGKGESVSDMNLLLGIPESDAIGEGWSVEYANVFGVPVEETMNSEIDPKTNTTSLAVTMTLKQVAIPELDSRKIDATMAVRIQMADRRWIFGEDFDSASSNRMGISRESICRLLEFGCGPSIRINAMSNT